MPGQRAHSRRRVCLYPGGFPDRLELLQGRSGLPRAGIARRVVVDPLTVRRWWKYGVRPSVRHQVALLIVRREPGPLPHTDRLEHRGCDVRPGPERPWLRGRHEGWPADPLQEHEGEGPHAGGADAGQGCQGREDFGPWGCCCPAILSVQMESEFVSGSG